MNPLVSRRRFCVSATLFPVLLADVPRRGRAAPRAAAGPDSDAQTLYGTGTRMLREGRAFEKAAAHLEKACQREPENADYALALGCAYASRAASLAWAGGYVPAQWSGEVSVWSLFRLRELARGVLGYAEGLADDKQNGAEAVRVLRGTLRMGERMMGDPWPLLAVENQALGARAIMGSSVVRTAYEGLAFVLKMQNDPDALTALIGERDEWNARWYKWLAQTGENVTPSVYDWYDAGVVHAGVVHAGVVHAGVVHAGVVHAG